MTYAEAITAVNSLTTGQKIRAIATKTGFVRVYDPTLGGTVAAASANLPNVFAIATNSVAGDISGPNDYNDAAPWYSDPSAGTPIVGTVRLHLVPVSGSPDASSVQVVTLAGNNSDVVVTATG